MTTLSIIIDPFTQNLPIALKVLYFVGLLIVGLIMSVIVVRVLQLLFHSNKDDVTPSIASGHDSTQFNTSEGSTAINAPGGIVYKADRDINIHEKPKRTLTLFVQQRMLEILQETQPLKIAFASTQGDLEADQFKQQLMSLFQTAGWQVVDAATFMFFGSRRGIVLTIPFNARQDGAAQVIARALALTGPIAGNKGDMANETGFYVQVWHAP